MIDVIVYQAELQSTYESVTDEADFIAKQQKYASVNLPLATYRPDSSYQYLVESSSDLLVLNKDQLVAYTIAGVQLSKVKEVITRVDIAEYLPKLGDKAIPMGAPSHNEYTTLCEVHMPGQALSMYNDMKLLEDSCSDAVQEALNEGWRIIAACPQPDQRRPDYILGRFDPKHDGERSAKR